MLIAVIPIVVMIVGILLWVLAGNAILKDIGRWMFIIGLLCSVWPTMGKTVKIGSATPSALTDGMPRLS